MNNGLFGFPGPYTRTGGDGLEVITSSQRRAWPDGARYLKCRLQAGGGGGTGNNSSPSGDGADGGDTTITYAGTTYTVNGGSGGEHGQQPVGGTGGDCTLNVSGKRSDSLLGVAATSSAYPTHGGGGYGIPESGGGGAAACDGGGGEYGEVLLERKPGCNWIEIVVGAGGSPGSSGTGAYATGADGLVILEWLPPLHTA